MRINPPITKSILIRFNLSIGSLRKIRADMQTKNVAEQDIILTSPRGICFMAKYPIVMPQVPIAPLPTSLSRLPDGKIGCFLKKMDMNSQGLI